MNYENMWDELKAKLVAQKNTDGIFAMSQIELSYAERVCECQTGGETRKCNCSADAPEDADEKPGDDEESVILGKIFGHKIISDLDSLKEAIGTMSDTHIVCDGRLDIPEELRALAKEKKIVIGEARCEKIPFPVGALIKSILES